MIMIIMMKKRILGLGFFISSKEEDDLLTGFVDWFCSLDGGRKPRRTALKHKSVLMSIVRYDEEQSPDLQKYLQ